MSQVKFYYNHYSQMLQLFLPDATQALDFCFKLSSTDHNQISQYEKQHWKKIKRKVFYEKKSANTNQAKHKDGKVTMMLQGHIFTCQMQY